MKKIAILQSNYLPWIGYFDLISSVDEFIIYDCMQYTKRDWRNRNQIKTPQGKQWITVPIKSKGEFKQSIYEAEILDDQWKEQHWKSISMNYSKAPFFLEIQDLLEPIYNSNIISLSELNTSLIKLICKYLGIATRISQSNQYKLNGEKSYRLMDICIQSRASCYVSGPSAKEYLDLEIFKKHHIQVEWFEYGAYNNYKQLWGEFEPTVSIIDVLCNCGPNTSKFLKNTI